MSGSAFANERTFLAWVRTALAMLAAAVALDSFDSALPPPVRRTLAVLLVVLALVCVTASWLR